MLLSIHALDASTAILEFAAAVLVIASSIAWMLVARRLRRDLLRSSGEGDEIGLRWSAAELWRYPPRPRTH